MQGVLIFNAFLNQKSFHTIYDSFLEACKRINVHLEPVANDAFCTPFLPKSVQEADFVLFWDKDVLLAKTLEMQGKKVYNCADSIEKSDDKRKTYISLLEIVPQPKSIFAPLTFDTYTNDVFVTHVVETLGLPFVLKQAFGSFGEQVYLIHTVQQAKEFVHSLAPAPLLFQEYIASSFARDVRLYMVGDSCVAAMERQNLQGDFRANVQLGGCARKHIPTAQEISLAKKATKALGLTFSGVDLLFGSNTPLVCEVNSNAHFNALQSLTGVNVAQSIMEEVVSQCKGL